MISTCAPTMVPPLLDLPLDPPEANDGELKSQVHSLLATLYPNHGIAERRRETRYPFPYLVQLTPVGDDGRSPCGETIAVVGKHLSERGLGFYHPKPLPHRRMIAAIEVGEGQSLAFLIDLSWCRFTRQGWYESGGRFLDTVPAPLQRAS